MKTIWKFPLQLVETQTVEMPAMPEFLDVQVQGAASRAPQCQLWAVVEPSMPRIKVEIGCYGTGHAIPDNPGRYLGTVQGGPFVWHYFARNHV